MWAFYVPQLWPCQIWAGHTVDTWDWSREFNQSLVFLKTWSSSSDFTQHQFLCSSHHEFTHGSADIVQSFTAYENINLYISISRLLQIALIWVCFQTTGVKKSVLRMRSQPATTSVLYAECFLLELSEQCVYHQGSVSSFGFRWQAVITKVRRLSNCL